MQLDCFELKTNFLTLNKNSISFTGCVNRLFQKCENLIKVISSPTETIKENYYKLIEGANDADLDKIMNLIVFKKNENENKKNNTRAGK